MVLTAEQQWIVAMAYETAAAASMGVPTPQRAAFARKAKRFRTLARIAAKIQATAVIKDPTPQRSPHTPVVPQHWASNFDLATKAKYPTLAERLREARAASSLPLAAGTPDRAAKQEAPLAGGAKFGSVGRPSLRATLPSN